MKLYVVLYCWYDGDGEFIDNSFIAVAKDIATLAMYLQDGDILVLPGESYRKYVDKQYCFYRIIEQEI